MFVSFGMNQAARKVKAEGMARRWRIGFPGAPAPSLSWLKAPMNAVCHGEERSDVASHLAFQLDCRARQAGPAKSNPISSLTGVRSASWYSGGLLRRCASRNGRLFSKGHFAEAPSPVFSVLPIRAAFRYLPRASFGPRPRAVSAPTIRPSKPAILVDKYFARRAVNRACFLPCLFGVW